jgi:hypothetical protein
VVEIYTEPVAPVEQAIKLVKDELHANELYVVVGRFVPEISKNVNVFPNPSLDTKGLVPIQPIILFALGSDTIVPVITLKDPKLNSVV